MGDYGSFTYDSIYGVEDAELHHPLDGVFDESVTGGVYDETLTGGEVL